MSSCWKIGAELLIIEQGSDQMQQASFQADAIAVCRIPWVEAMAGMARRQREKPNDSEVLEQARQQLIRSWPLCTMVEVNQQLVAAAGRFVDAFALRGDDSVQLAVAHELHRSTDQSLTFASCEKAATTGRARPQALALLALTALPSRHPPWPP